MLRNIDSLLNVNSFCAPEVEAEYLEQRLCRILPVNANDATALPHIIRFVERQVCFACVNKTLLSTDRNFTV